MRHGFPFRRFGHGIEANHGLVFFEEPGEKGGGGNVPPRENPADIAAKYSGDVVRMASDLSSAQHDNFKLREDKRNLNATITGLQAKVPAEGAVILIGDDVKVWEAYNALGKPEEVKTAVETGKAAISERDTFKRDQVLADAAKEARLKPGLLKILAKDLDVQIREVDVVSEDGTTTTKAKRPVVVTKNGDQTSDKPLRDFFKEQGEDVLQSLEAGESDGQFQQPNAQGGVTYPVQGAGSPAAKTNFGALAAGRYDHNAPKAEAKSANYSSRFYRRLSHPRPFARRWNQA